MKSGAIRLSIVAVLLAVSLAALTQVGQGTAQESTSDSDNVRLYFFRDDELGVAVRDQARLVQDTSIFFATLVELFQGPADDELGAGLTTLLPDDVTIGGSIVLEEGVATVDLSSGFADGPNEGQPATPALLARRMAQVVFTLTQFDEISSVRFQVDGQPINALDSDGATVFRPVTREDYASITPIILVESPGVWERLTSPLHLTGSANTFEANVQYRLTDARGTTVIAGFFSATSGSGTRGTFDEEIAFEVTRQGRATLVLFEQSAVDGSDINVVAIPIEIVRSETPTPTAEAGSPTIAPASPTSAPSSPTQTATAVGSPTEMPTGEPTSTGEATATMEVTATGTVIATATATIEPTTPPSPSSTAIQTATQLPPMTPTPDP